MPVLGQHRTTNRYRPVPGDFEQRLVEAMKELADRFPRFGYRRVHALLVTEGWPVNLKRVHRLWLLEGLRVPRDAWIVGRRPSGPGSSRLGRCRH